MLSLTSAAVLFKFRSEVTEEHKAIFVRELKKLKHLPCVKDGRLIVGGPSVTDPIERSKGFQYALVSYHHDRKALEEYQVSKEHHWWVVTIGTRECRADYLQGYFNVSAAIPGGSLSI